MHALHFPSRWCFHHLLSSVVKSRLHNQGVSARPRACNELPSGGEGADSGCICIQEGVSDLPCTARRPSPSARASRSTGCARKRTVLRLHVRIPPAGVRGGRPVGLARDCLACVRWTSRYPSPTTTKTKETQTWTVRRIRRRKRSPKRRT